jgi:hypothetical protein
MLADNVLPTRRRPGVTFRPTDENNPKNRFPPRPAKPPPVASVKQKLSFDDQDTLTLTPDQFAAPVQPPSLRQLLDEYARFAEAPSHDSPTLPARPPDPGHTATLEFDREVRKPEFRTIDLSVSEDSIVDFASSDAAAPPADRPPLESRFHVKPKQRNAALRPILSSDDDLMPRRQRPPRLSPQPAEVDTDLIDRLMAEQRQLDLDEESITQVSFDDDHSPILAGPPRGSPDAEIAALRDAASRLPAVVLRNVTQRLRREVAAFGRLPDRVAVRPDELHVAAASHILARMIEFASELPTVCMDLAAAERKVRELSSSQHSMEEVEQRIDELRRHATEKVRGEVSNSYLVLRRLLPFSVSTLRTKAAPSAAVNLRNEIVTITSADAGPVHTKVAVQERWRRFRGEFLRMMRKVHGLMFADQVLSFLVVSERLRCRFAVVLRIPTSYPWCRVTVSAVRVDFGADFEETRQIIQEVARSTPIGDLWLTRFVDAVCDRFPLR